MQRRLQDRHAVVLEHVEQRRLAGIVEAQEQQLGVLVEQAERRQDVVDWWAGSKTSAQFTRSQRRIVRWTIISTMAVPRRPAITASHQEPQKIKHLHQLTIHMAAFVRSFVRSAGR